MDPLVGAIEAGGTKMVLALGRSWHEVRDAEHTVLATTTPDETLDRVMNWFTRQNKERHLSAIGVASFGPLDLGSRAISMSTPKTAWRGVSWAQAISGRLGDIPLGCDTDTGAAALAEQRWGAGRDKGVVVYMTIGTGIGGGLVVDGHVVHGLMHPEFGHMVVQRRGGDDFAGTCPAHGDCLEGLACGPAIEQRWGCPEAWELPARHPAWELESDYLADAIVNVLTITAAEVIVLGGGVMMVPGLIDRVRVKVREHLNGYIDVPALGRGIADFLVAPGLGRASGVVGAFALGRDALT